MEGVWLPQRSPPVGSLAPSRLALWREEERRDRGRDGGMKEERGRKGKREEEIEVEEGGE